MNVLVPAHLLPPVFVIMFRNTPEVGTVMAHVVVRVGDNLIESAITRRSAAELALNKGDTVTAIIKSTEGMIQKD